MTGERRYEIGFAVGNLVPVVVLGLGLFALPVRWWPADFVIGGGLLLLVITSTLVLSRPAKARVGLRVGATTLLAIGLLLIAAAVLSLAFLAGIHGDFGRGGVTLMVLVSFLVLPYAVVYPAVQLLWLGPSPRRSKASPVSKESTAVKAEAAVAPASEAAPAEPSRGDAGPEGESGAPA